MNIMDLVNKYALKINGVIHIGAHHAEEYNDYVKLGINNMVFFEPLPYNFNILLNNIKLSNTVVAYNMALGNFEGETDMFTEATDWGGSGSILKPEIHLALHPTVIFRGKKQIKISRLDNIEYDRNIHNFICVDVQGYELEVLKGAICSLKFVDYIMAEVNKDYVYKDCVLVTELDLFLSDFGFVRVETDWNGVLHGDALYIKNNLIKS